MPPEMIGKITLEKHGKSDANAVVLQELRLRHALLHEENFEHSYPFCWRSKTPVIYRAMDQWFIRIDHPLSGVAADGTPPRTSPAFRAAALAEIDRVQWIPAWGVNRIKSAVESRPDWCISRQRSWACRFPPFTTTKARRFWTQESSATRRTWLKSTARTSGSKNPRRNCGRLSNQRIGQAPNPPPSRATPWMSGLIPAPPPAPS